MIRFLLVMADMLLFQESALLIHRVLVTEVMEVEEVQELRLVQLLTLAEQRMWSIQISHTIV
jgi:hypothetical protein